MLWLGKQSQIHMIRVDLYTQSSVKGKITGPVLHRTSCSLQYIGNYDRTSQRQWSHGSAASARIYTRTDSVI